MKKYLKIISFNIVVFATLILLLDLFSLVTLNLWFLKREKYKKSIFVDFRTKFPVYKNHYWPKDFYNELYKLNIEYRSNYGWRATKFNGNAINIDSNGIRKTIDYQPEYKKNTSISFFGGSTIWGFGVNDSNTIPSLFSKINNGNFKITNYGEQAYRSFQSLQLMQTEFANKELSDFVIFYDGVNNYRAVNERIFSTNRELQIIQRLKGMDKDLNGVENYKNDAEYFSKHYLYPTKYLLNKVITKINFKRKKANNLPKVINNNYSDSLAAIELLETWLIAKNYVESRNKNFICILQPNYFTSNSPLSYYIKESIQKSPYTKETYNYYRLLKIFINFPRYKQLKTNFVDMSNEFNKKDSIYIDFCHLGPDGNFIIANDIFNIINKKQNGFYH